MQKSEDSSFSSPSLLCDEVHHTTSILVHEDSHCLAIGQQQDDDEYVEMLLDREINHNNNGLHKCSGSWIEEARLNAIQYILDTSLSFGFKIETSYLAVTYLDRFLSRRFIEEKKYWAVRLLAMACLSLAAKMEECKVPLLSEFPSEDYNFECNVIRRMEVVVLDALDWRMALATPFTFTYYFASKLCETNLIRETMSRVIEIISATIKNVKMTYHTPSAIAAAATLLILDQRMTRETLVLKINTLSTSNFLKIDDIISFYNEMKELDMDRFKPSKSIQSPVLTPVQLESETDALGSSLMTSSGVSAKRKSLTFNDEGGQNIKMPDSKRHC